MNEETMNRIIKRCQEDEEYAKAFDFLMKASQAAAHAGFTNEDMASICIMGWMIGTDPDLGAMIKNMSKISKMGLDIVDK
jgi:hypothetical protein